MTDGWGETPEEEFGVGNFRRAIGIYANRGEPVTCENGHVICSFGRDVYVGEFFDADATVEWKQRRPNIGDMEQPCEECGARWFKGVYLHFNDGWRI